MLAPFPALVVSGHRPDGGGDVHPDVPDALARHLAGLPASGRYQSPELVRSALRDGRYRRPAGHSLFRYRVIDAAGADVVSGVVGSVAVDDPGVPLLPHEETLPGEAALRRRERWRATADTRPIVVITPATLPELPADGPEIRIHHDGAVHAVAPLRPASTASIAETLRGHPLVIADGHHRHAVALEHRAALGPDVASGPWDCIMALVVGSSGRALGAAAFHRRFDSVAVPDPPRLTERFEVDPAPPEPQAPPPGRLIWWPAAGTPLMLRPRPGSLRGVAEPLRASSAAVARALLYPMLGVGEADARYEAEATRAVAAAAEGGGAVLLSGSDPETVVRAAAAGVRFPPKSTLFRPKPLRGVLIRLLDAGVSR